MVYGIILMGLALYKAAEYWRMSAGFKGFALVKVLIKDQVLYFIWRVRLISIGMIWHFRHKGDFNLHFRIDGFQCSDIKSISCEYHSGIGRSISPLYSWKHLVFQSESSWRNRSQSRNKLQDKDRQWNGICIIHGHAQGMILFSSV